MVTAVFDDRVRSSRDVSAGTTTTLEAFENVQAEERPGFVTHADGAFAISSASRQVRWLYTCALGFEGAHAPLFPPIAAPRVGANRRGIICAKKDLVAVLPEATCHLESSDARGDRLWEGAGVVDIMAEHANETISDPDFARQRKLPDGGLLNSKEELLYYRIFREQFGDVADLSFVGRTKGAPVDP